MIIQRQTICGIEWWDLLAVERALILYLDDYEEKQRKLKALEAEKRGHYEDFRYLDERTIEKCEEMAVNTMDTPMYSAHLS